MGTSVLILLVLGMDGSLFGGAAGDIPTALLALEEARKDIISGRIEWVVMSGPDDPATLSCVSRFAKNGDDIFENRGDEDGWTVFHPDSKLGASMYPQIYMRNTDGEWHYQETGTHAQWWGPDTPTDQSFVMDYIKDIRMVGISPFTRSMKAAVGFEAIWNLPHTDAPEWEQTQVGDVYVVRATYNNGAAEARWEINPNKGWNVERATLTNATNSYEVRCILKQYGDVWFPEKTQYFKNGGLTDSISVRSASINQPTDPRQFTLADLGAEPGTHVSAQHLPTAIGKPRIWNGDAISSWDQWEQDVRDGKCQWGPTFREMHKRRRYDSPYMLPEDRQRRKFSKITHALRSALTAYDELWEAYVRDFIARYQLDEEQSAKAMRILADCQQRAGKIVERIRPEVTSLSSQLQHATKDDDRERVAELQKRVDKLRAPINGIFNESLLPRLEKLPTRKQREAADKRLAETQPAKSDKP
ncbi:MAG: hypothetical protein ABIG44_10555 [Planctomycetota bacterium]